MVAETGAGDDSVSDEAEELDICALGGEAGGAVRGDSDSRTAGRVGVDDTPRLRVVVELARRDFDGEVGAETVPPRRRAEERGGTDVDVFGSLTDVDVFGSLTVSAREFSRAASTVTTTGSIFSAVKKILVDIQKKM